MVWYYCEFCNKNINISAEVKAVCTQCGHILLKQTMTQAERNRRNKERTFYCSNCDQMVYCVALDTLKRHALARLSGGHDMLCCIFSLLISILFLVAIVGGIGMFFTGESDIAETLAGVIASGVLAGIFLILMLYFKKAKEKKEQKKEDIEISIRELSKNYRYVCGKCYDGVSSKRKEVQTVQQESVFKYCEFCGIENVASAKICVECGSELRMISLGKQDSRNITNKVRTEVWNRDNGRCVNCGSQVNLEFDHIIPYSKGGSSSANNIQLLRKSCNLEKSNKI